MAGARVWYPLVVAASAALALTWTACAREASEPAQAAAAAPAAPGEDARPVVLFLGDSLTAGYGLTEEQAFPALLQQRMDRAQLGLRVVNAGVSGDTSAGGLRRIDWLLRLPVAVLVVALGGNDMLRGLPPEQLRENLAGILEAARERHPEVRLVVAGMRAPGNLGRRYVRAFEGAYPEVADRHDALLVPFLLDGVAGDARLNQPDGIHPTAEGQRIIADELWPRLEPVLREAARARSAA